MARGRTKSKKKASPAKKKKVSRPRPARKARTPARSATSGRAKKTSPRPPTRRAPARRATAAKRSPVEPLPGTRLLDAAGRAVKGALKVKPAERVLLVTDRPKLVIAEALAHWCHHVRAETTLYLMAESLRPITEVTSLVRAMIEKADLTAYMLDSRIEEKGFRQGLVESGTRHGRICMMPGITVEMMERLVNVNYRELKDLGQGIVARVSGARQVRVTNPRGTDVTFSVFGRRWLIDDGDISQRGFHGNLPAGECFTAPVEDGFNGEIHFSLIDEYVGEGMVRFHNGRVADAHGKGLTRVLRHIGRDAGGKVIGEVGIGTNRNARLCENMLEAEKAFGTVHFAIGDSYGLGPNRSRHHYDMLVEKATVVADGQVILEHGKFRV